MQTDKKSKNLPLVPAGLQKDRVGTNSHFAIVTDDCGIHSAFELVKIKLKNEFYSFLSLIYSVSDPLSPPLFVTELESLERRYFSQLITYYEYSGSISLRDNSETNQELLEIVINCNTCEQMQFLLFGREEFVARISDRLFFLGINSNQIHSHIIK
jgi:hypothetical protein